MNAPLFLRILPVIAAIGAAGTGAGCVSHRVTVDAVYRSDPRSGRSPSYQIVYRNSPGASDGLRNAELAEHIRTALSAGGWHEMPAAARPEVVVEVEFGLGRSRVEIEDRWVPMVGRNLGQDGASRQVLWYEDVVVPVIVHEKYLVVSAREREAARPAAPPAELWRISVSIEDESRDLRRSAPILAAAAMEKIRAGGSGVSVTTLGDADSAVEYIRKGM